MSDTKQPEGQAAWNDGLHFLKQQCTTDSKRWFPGKAQELPNLVLCLAGEVGEVANLVKKHVRGSMSHEDMMQELPEEVVDVLIYLLNLMGHEAFKDVDWMDLWYKKRKFNEERFGDHRSESQRYLEGDNV
jgi:NTP pyrophosphatase (non-canonical NTP hydrolase)